METARNVKWLINHLYVVVDVNRSVRWTAVTYLVGSLLIQACQGTP
jgi:hypothetical protein